VIVQGSKLSYSRTREERCFPSITSKGIKKFVVLDLFEVEHPLLPRK